MKLYDERDAFELDQAGKYYTKHVVAMTKEGLESKGDIAAELGHRDMLIDQLKAQVEQLRNAAIQALHADDIEDEEDRASVFDKLNDAVLATPAQCLAEIKAHAESEFMKALFYAPSSPVSAQKAQEIEVWYGKVKALSQAAKGGV